MSGYFNDVMGYFLKLFKKEKQAITNDVTACSTPPIRSNSVIENRRLKEDTIKQKGAWSSTDGKIVQQKPHFCLDSCCSKIVFHNPTTCGKFLNHEMDTKQPNERIDSLNYPRECCCRHEAQLSKEFPCFLPSSARVESYGHPLRRSFSLESCCPLEGKNRLFSRETFQRHQNLSPIDNAGGMCLSLNLDKDYEPFKVIDLTPAKHSEGSSASQNGFVDDCRPKKSRIPTYRKKHRAVGKSRSMPLYLKTQYPSVVPKEPVCTCYYTDLLTSAAQKDWRTEGHAFYCPKSKVAYRSYLNTKLENLFRVISKKKYCGNIIDAASHSRWMKLAAVGVDENAACFKKFAKGRVVLPISEYKGALQTVCFEAKIDYWDLVQKMTTIEIGSGDSNSMINGWKRNK